MKPPDLWSRIPAELADEISGHNADDVSTVRAMSLVSKTMRSSAITHLCSVIHFACVEDFSLWLDMLQWRPRLETIVKKVKFSDPDEFWVERHPRLQFATKLAHAPVPLIIRPMPNVRVVEWAPAYPCDPTIGIAYMALFPSIEKLHLRNISFSRLVPLTSFLGACRSLKGLSLTEVGFDESGPDADHLDDTDDRFNLTALEELTISSIDPESEKDYVVELLEISPPAALKSLSFGVDFGACGCGLQPCAITTIKKVVELGARSVINLAIEPTFGLGDSEEFLNMAVLEIFDCLPVLPTLDSLTIWLSPNYQAEGLINRLTAPNLTTLIFRIVFNQRNYGHEYVLHSDDFNLMLETVFPWGPYVSGSMKRPLTRKFPLLRQIRFHFCAYRTSDLHSKRGLRRQIERRLKERLKETGADVEEYLELAWLDEDYNLVTYGDCESDNSDEKASDCESGSSEEASDSKSGDSDEEASDCESDNSDEDLDE